MSAALSVDFVDPERAAAALLRVVDGEGGSWLVVDGGDVTGGDAGPDGVRIADDGDRAVASLTLDDGGLELEARRVVGVSLEEGSAFADATGSTLEASAARVEGRWGLGERRRVEATGRIVRTSGEPDWTRVELVRSLTAVLEDGSFVVVAAARPTGAAGHGDEITEAVAVASDGALTRFDEVLLSTEYGPDGRHRRAGVELWAPGDAAPLRGAGTLIGGTGAVAFLVFSVNGAAGTARYELMRRG
ncbi:MAG TPA: hypothetical protein VK920_09240 [Solirubrobacterales bacterium]|nr:hypothetical protein [Solirubrobacterales bacterium]